MKNPVPIIFPLLLFLINTAAIAQNRVVVIPMGGDKGTVAKTGQTLCYDPACYCYNPGSGEPECTPGFSCPEVPCADTGQDGELQEGYAVMPRFTDNGNGTVTDRLTGLTWLQDSECTSFFSGDPNHAQNQRSWQEALDSVNKLSSGYCGLDDGSGAGDWRLPNIRELLSLVDYSQADPALAPGYPSSSLVSDIYWSSTSHPGGTYAAWGVGFMYGGDTWQYKSDNHYVLAVRGGR